MLNANNWWMRIDKIMERAPTPAASKESEADWYTFGMHPDVHLDKPGKCLKCGTNLVR